MSDEHEADRAEAERLRRQQALRVEEEAEMAENAADDAERAVHKRRSDKAAYLEEKLEEQVESTEDD
jgi:hypothetical protein